MDNALALLQRFRDPQLVRKLVRVIEHYADRIAEQRKHKGDTEADGKARPIRIMEVCGTHTVAIARAGFRSILPENVKLISGPGCPVCVTAQVDIDRIIALTRIPNVVVTTFGDMIRVPGSRTSLQQRQAEGAAVELIYSPLDAVRLAARFAQEYCNGSSQHLVLAGVGFETTTPLVAASIERAVALGLDTFSVLSLHKQVAPVLRMLAKDQATALDALILPGHVSTIIGIKPYDFLASEYHIPGMITGFEPVDILQGIAQLLKQLALVEQGMSAAQIEIAYSRAVMREGNPTAQAATDRVFESSDATWRGFGKISESAFALREEYAFYDASSRFAHELATLAEPTIEPEGCRCGDILRGALLPHECPLFGSVCTPQSPVGPCMVSSEGSCAAQYRYHPSAP